jgi:hypothetical protein
MALHLLNNSTGQGASDAARAAAGTWHENVATEEHAATIQSPLRADPQQGPEP